jgi:putative signal transducing protein
MNDFVLAKVCSSRIEADLLKAYLECEEIEVIIRADDAGGMIPSLTFPNGVSLFVPQEDLVRAQQIINNS